MTARDDLFASFRRAKQLTPREAAGLDAILNASPVQKAIVDMEREQLKGRTALLAKRGALDKQFEQGAPERAAHRQAAAAALEKAERALREARAADVQAEALFRAAEFGYRRERDAITAELLEGADHRFAEFARYVGEIVTADLRAAFSFWIDPGGRRADRTLYRSNSDEYNAAKMACTQVLAEVADAQLAAISYAEVGQLLGQWCERLAPVLAKMQLNPPQLAAADAEPGPSLRWTGSSRWIVEKLRDRKALRSEKAAERAVRMGNKVPETAEKEL